jgi:DNA-binding NtrC family response regulator
MSSSGEKPTKVLLVDDDPTYRQLLKNALHQPGLVVITAHETMDALSLFESNSDILHVIVDLRMPLSKPNGLSFARMADFKRAGTKVILISGEPELLAADLLFTFEAEKFGDVLAKDDGLPALVAKIRQRFDLNPA